MKDNFLSLDNTIPNKESHRRASAQGTIILGRYKVLSELGRGGMGVVYRCFDEVAQIEVAVKGLPPEVSRNQTEMEDIRDNFKLVSGLRHQNITGIRQLEADEATGDYYLIMDIAEGENLHKWLKRHRDPEFNALKISIIDELAAALDYAHSKKIMHRDIKPENVIIDTENHVHVLDFGLASQIRSSLSRVSLITTSTSGTSSYKSPEQWQGRPQNAKTDQYSLGVMAYEMMAGHLPFDSDDMAILRMSVLSDKVPPIENLPAKVNAAFSRAMAKDPRERFDSCADFVTALNGGKAPKSRNSSDVLKMFLGASVLLGLLCGIGGIAYYQQVKEAKEAELAMVELRRMSDLLSSRAEQAMNFVKENGYVTDPDLAEECKKMQGYYMAAGKAVKAKDYISATNNFENVGVCKRNIDSILKNREEEKKRRHENEKRVDELVAKGYVRVVGSNGEQDAVWEEGVEHPYCKLLVSGKLAESWRAVEAGYEWDGKDGVKWISGIEHPDHSHWISSHNAGEWIPKVGYGPAGYDTGKLYKLKWIPHIESGNRRTSIHEGVWEKKKYCSLCGGSKIEKVKRNCSSCNGSGKVESLRNCRYCNGQGYVSRETGCSACSGRGRVRTRCLVCGQVKAPNGVVLCEHAVQCSLCKGMRSIIRNHLFQRIAVPCTQCNGHGWQRHGACNVSGWIESTCKTCNGAGKTVSPQRCGYCNGRRTETVFEACRKCFSGKVEIDESCSQCRGEGYVWTVDSSN